MKHFIILSILFSGVVQGQSGSDLVPTGITKDSAYRWAIQMAKKEGVSSLYPQDLPVVIDTSKAIVQVYQPGPVALQQRVWIVRKRWPQIVHPPNFPVDMTETDPGKWVVQKYLDTDRKTPISFTHVWNTAYVEW